YAISSAKTASVSISIDGGTATLVNLTQMYNLNNRSGIYFPVYAWSATNLDPNTEHKFYLEYAQANPSGAGLWTGFDSLIYTPSTPTVASTTSTPTPSVSYIPSKNTSAPGVNGKLIGGIFAGTLAILIVAFAFTYWCHPPRDDGTFLRSIFRVGAVGIPTNKLSASEAVYGVHSAFGHYKNNYSNRYHHHTIPQLTLFATSPSNLFAWHSISSPFTPFQLVYTDNTGKGSVPSTSPSSPSSTRLSIRHSFVYSRLRSIQSSKSDVLKSVQQSVIDLRVKPSNPW
ncbi:hypothetical protein FRC00_010773, partial [Tulasnella sp. 408]